MRTRMSKGQALKRVVRARTLIPRRTFQGDDVPAEWKHTANALSCGSIGDEHVEMIRTFLTALPARVDPITRAQAERTLADVATRLDPRGVNVPAMHLLAMLHPDGRFEWIEPSDLTGNATREHDDPLQAEHQSNSS